MATKYKYQTITITHAALNTDAVIDFDTNAAYSRIVGLRILGSAAGNFSDGLKIDGEEIFPPGFDFETLQSDVTVSPNERYYSEGIDYPAKGKKITGKSIVTSGALVLKIELKYVDEKFV